MSNAATVFVNHLCVEHADACAENSHTRDIACCTIRNGLLHAPVLLLTAVSSSSSGYKQLHVFRRQPYLIRLKGTVAFSEKLQYISLRCLFSHVRALCTAVVRVHCTTGQVSPLGIREMSQLKTDPSRHISKARNTKTTERPFTKGAC